VCLLRGTDWIFILNAYVCIIRVNFLLEKALPWLRRLVAGLSPRRPGFDPRSVHMGFVVDKVALGLVFLPVLQFSPVSIIPPMLHTHLHLHIALIRRRNGEVCEPTIKQCPLGNRGALARKVLPLLFLSRSLGGGP
jgi:hypothetical protein